MTDKHQPPKKSLLYNAVIVLLVMMFLNAFVFPLFTQPRVTEVTYDRFLEMLDKGEVREVALDDTSSTILFLAEVEGAEGVYRTGAWPDDDLTQRLLSHPEVSFETEIIEETSPLVQFLVGWVLPYGHHLRRGLPADAQPAKAHGRRERHELWQGQRQDRRRGEDRRHL